MTIYVECKADRALVSAVTRVARRDIVHELKGKYEVCIRVAKQQSCTALIDEDPGAIVPPYVRRLRQTAGGEDMIEDGLTVLDDSARGNRVVIVCPRLEGWVLAAAKEVGTNVRAYGLPTGELELHRQVNERLDQFSGLLEALKSERSPRLSRLGKLLSGA